MTRCDEAILPEWERPVRVPESVQVGVADPPCAIALQKGSWRVPLRLDRDVEAGEVLQFIVKHHRNVKGLFMLDGGSISARDASGSALAVETTDHDGLFRIEVSQKGLRAGDVVEVQIRNAMAPRERQPSKFFILAQERADPKPGPTEVGGWGKIRAACMVHVLGGATHHLRAYAPSQTRPGEAFHILVRPEDEPCNLSCRSVKDLKVSLNGSPLPATARPVEGSTCVRLRVALPTEGIHRLAVEDGSSHLKTTTNPTVCRASTPGNRFYWGTIHGHTEMSDGTGSVERYFRQMRDEAALDFAAPGDHDHLKETSDEMWAATCESVARWNEPGRFVTFLGYEWAKWRRNGDGDRNVYYLEDHRPLYRSDEGHYPAPPDLFRAIADEQALVIPHHTGHAGNFCDWKDHDPVHERLVEIFQMRGSYECGADAGNPAPEQSDRPPFEDGFVSRALALGWRVGFTAGGDDHVGHTGLEFPIPHGSANYKAGMMGVLATERTREAIWDALWNRRVLATTGPRILLDYTLNGRPMGSEIDCVADPYVAERRRLHVTFHGTAPLRRIDIIRNNQVAQSYLGESRQDFEFTWEDGEGLEDVCLPPARFSERPFCFYYVRAVQTDGEVAWASPVWIDGER